MKKTFLFLLTFTFLGILRSQTVAPNIIFSDSIFDFGQVKEELGSVSHKFMFKNTGGNPLIISQVKASCGCTTPEWTRDPIMPGSDGYVQATYDPVNRPGSFNKTVTVISNGIRNSITLVIRGEVIPKAKTKDDDYPVAFGDLKVVTNRVGFVKVLNTDSKIETVGTYNPTQKPVRIKFGNIPKHLIIKAVPDTLKPGAEGKIQITFDGTKKNEWDYTLDNFQVFVNDDVEAAGSIVVSANIQEDFSKLTEKELESAPICFFDVKEFDFGTVTQGEIVLHRFIFSNEGKKELIIRSIKPSCGCTTARFDNKVIPPHGTSEIDILFDTNSRKEMQNKSINVTTNDPRNPRIILWIKGIVQEKQ